MVSERQIRELANTMWGKDGLTEGKYLEHYSIVIRLKGPLDYVSEKKA